MKFYDPKSVCPKCGCKLVTTEFNRDCRSTTQPDTIKRQCERCRYVWRELPLDAAEKESSHV